MNPNLSPRSQRVIVTRVMIMHTGDDNNARSRRPCRYLSNSWKPVKVSLHLSVLGPCLTAVAAAGWPAMAFICHTCQSPRFALQKSTKCHISLLFSLKRTYAMLEEDLCHVKTTPAIRGPEGGEMEDTGIDHPWHQQVLENLPLKKGPFCESAKTAKQYFYSSN